MPKARIPENWPILLLTVVAIWLTRPLWMATDQVFGGILVSDGAQGPWFYDFIARALANGQGLANLTDFNHPSPYLRQDEIPGVADAILAAPAAWLFDWPRQYGVAQALAMLTNGLGFAWLAKSMGCRGLGVFVSGFMGLCCTPALKELHLARVNAAWPGVLGAALAAWIGVLSPGSGSAAPTWTQGVLRMLVAALLGGLAAAIYPPFVLMLIPAGVVLAAPRLRETTPREWALALLAIALALAILWPELEGIRHSTRVSKPECIPGTCPTHVQPGGTMRALVPLACILEGFCPKGTLSIPLSGWFRLADDGQVVRMSAGLSVGTWILALLAPLNKTNRRRNLALMVWMGVLAFLALGPCAALAEGRPIGAANWPVLRAFMPRIWCETAVLHDYGRFATAAAVLAAPLSGLGIEALHDSLRDRTAPLRHAGLFLAVLACTQACIYTLSQLTNPDRWQSVPNLPTSAFLQAAEPGPVAELPFDSGLQFISVMEAPAHPRINPFNAVDSAPGSDPFVSWLYALGRGNLDESTPTLEHARRSGVRWVVFDPTRCRAPYMADKRPCEPAIAESLTAVLGEGEALPRGARAWEVTPGE